MRRVANHFAWTLLMLVVVAVLLMAEVRGQVLVPAIVLMWALFVTDVVRVQVHGGWDPSPTRDRRLEKGRPKYDPSPTRDEFWPGNGR